MPLIFIHCTSRSAAAVSPRSAVVYDPLNKRRDYNLGIASLVLVGLGIAWWKFPAFFEGVLQKLFH